MIIPDANMLLYAYNSGSPFQDPAIRWWEDLINGSERIGLPWVVTSAFVRLMTGSYVLEQPATAKAAFGYVQDWLQFPHITPINPGPDHLSLFRQNLIAAGAGGNLVTDAHIAALAIEYQAEVHSNDFDFGRFPGLRWRNPLR